MPIRFRNHAQCPRIEFDAAEAYAIHSSVDPNAVADLLKFGERSSDLGPGVIGKWLEIYHGFVGDRRAGGSAKQPECSL